MNLPTFPTDNLYKFLAISGLFIVIFSLVYPRTRLSEITQKTIELETKEKILNIKSAELTYEMAELKKEVEAAKKRKSESFTREELEKLLKKSVDFQLKNTEHEINLVNLEGVLKQINELHKEFHFEWQFIKIGGYLGLIISMVGFVSWYWLVQLPSDLLLRRQIENNQLKPSKKSHKKGQDGEVSEEDA